MSDEQDEKQADLDKDRVGHEDHALTTDQGIPVDHTDDSLKAGERGPTLMEDFHFREKLTRFDHERIPERVVHARGAGAYGYFECTDACADITRADFLQEPGRRVPVFVRFSTVAGSRGSADTVRDVRGFATKFYTREGNFDLVGNNMPVFFIQDGIKFPDFVHAVKPEPHNEIPQASSAHNTLWDFVSLQPETMHMMMWLMSDRALPRSFRMMQGFGVHTFRFVTADGTASFVKFHWRPKLGTHSLVWDETQKIAGKDPDFNRRDLYEAIESGAYPEWDFAVQVVPEERELDFDFDLLDPTKIIPEEEVPLRVIGRMVLDRNPDNFFAETEQAAFHIANVVPGIDFTNDPLLQARLFSYLDTQLIRLGGPNFVQLPVNRPVAQVHHDQRDGYGQHRIDIAKTSYHPNSIDGGWPQPEDGYRHYEERVDGRKIRLRSPTFADHFTQATLFWNSMSGPEQDHIVDAFGFELGKVDAPGVRERVLGELAQVDHGLATKVAAQLGLDAPPAGTTNHGRSSPALSQATQPVSPATRKIAILAADGVDAGEVRTLKEALEAQGAICEVLAPHDGSVGGLEVDRALVTMASVLYDAVVAADDLSADGDAVHYVLEAYKHAKPVGALGGGRKLLDGIDSSAPGVVVADDGGALAEGLLGALATHRHFERALAAVPA